MSSTPRGHMISIERGQDYENVNEADLPYKLLENLGFGHSGNVEKVRDQTTQAMFARKTIRITGRRLSRQEKAKVFYNEVKIIRALASHHHMIKVFATYTTEAHFGLILEPVASDGDLGSFIAKYWTVVDEARESNASNPDPRLEVMVTVLEQAFGCLITGLAFMCNQRIRHRDVKPNNILVHNGRVLYTDFGYSFDSSGFSHSTTEGRPSFLTRKYSAPEVLEYEKKSSKSDVFSLGCVFIEMLYALLQSPESEQEVDCYSKRMNEIHKRLQVMEIPPKYSMLSDTIREMTNCERSERPSAADVALKLRALPEIFCSQCNSENTAVAATIDLSESTLGTNSTISQPIERSSDMTLEWSEKHQWWFRKRWDTQYQRFYWIHYSSGQWVFFDWAPVGGAMPVVKPAGLVRSAPGESIRGKYNEENPQPNSHFESLDSSFYVRSRDFFTIGKVFAVLFTEAAGTTVTSYNDSISAVRFGEQIHTQVRRFVVIRQRNAFCFAIPIFTYNNRGTKKLGVVPDEHAIAYSYGSQPTLLIGEAELSKTPICIVMSDGVSALSVASRIFFGVHHAVQYNVKVKDVGVVHPDHLNNLLGYWKAKEDANENV